MRHSLLLTTLLALSSCASPLRHEASKAEIENTAKRLLTRCEPWAAQAQLYIGIRQNADDGTWRVTANALDPRHTECGCAIFIPGTGRELLFSRSGRFISCSSLP